MNNNRNTQNSAIKTRRKGLLRWMWGVVALFSAPQLIPIRTKSEQSTIRLAMSRREIGRVTQTIMKNALADK